MGKAPSKVGDDEISFLASLPPIQGAIRVGQDGMRLQFDVPEIEIGNAIRLVTWREKVLRIRIKPESRK